MKTLIIILLAISLSANAQTHNKKEQSIFEPSYVKIGLTQKQFVEWAKSIHSWYESGLLGGKPDATDSLEFTFDNHYRLFSMKLHTTYIYYFKGGVVIAMQIEPDTFDNFDTRLTRDHDFEKVVQKTKTTKIYVFSAKDYLVNVVERTVDNGWAEKKNYQLSIWPNG